MRRLVSVLILLCLSWQTTASPVAGALKAHVTEQDHSALHLLGEPHHHHDDDQSYHQDGSPESIQHVMADCSNHHLGLIVMPLLGTLESGPQPLLLAADLLPPEPYLDGLRRPPRALI